MRKSRYSFYVFIFLLCLVSADGLFAQVDLRYLSITDGLSNNTVTSITKDHHGFMWFGTYDGLNRYDGYTLKVFRNIANDTSSLKDNFIIDVKEDQLGKIWVGTKKGVSVLNGRGSHFRSVCIKTNDRQEEKSFIDSSSVNCIAIMGKHTVLIGTNGTGLFHVDNRYLTAVQLPFYEGSKRILQYDVKAILATSEDSVWLGIHGFGLCLYDVKKAKIELVKRTKADINSLIKIDGDRLVLGTDNSILIYAVQGKNFEKISDHKFGRVLSLTKDQSGLIWVSTDGKGVQVWNPLSGNEVPIEAMGLSKRIPSDAIYCVYEDEMSRKWVGTLRGGIAILDPHTSQFTSVKVKTGNGIGKPSENFIFSFCELNDGNILVGTDGSGIYLWDRKKRTFEKFVTTPRFPKAENIANMLLDNTGYLWVASYGGGLLKVNVASHTAVLVSSVDASTPDNVWALFKDKQGTIWVGNSNGLYFYNQRLQLLVPIFKSQSGVATIAEDSKQHLWIGSQNRIYEINKAGKQYQSLDMTEQVFSIYIENKDCKWIGTKGKGLIKINGRSAKKVYSEESGLSNNNVLTIQQDSLGRLWASTFNGLNRIDPLTDEIDRFYEVDGLQSNQFYYNAVMKSKSGELFFGGINGLTYFLPRTQLFNDGFPKVVITDIRVMNSTVLNNTTYFDEATWKIEIPFEEAVLSVDYAALEYSFPKKISYAYRLKGWDTEWNDAKAVRTANYSGLREGSYVLQIRTTSTMGKWNPQMLEIPVVILPPWYRSWPAYLCYGLVFLGIGILILSYRVRQLKAQHSIQIAQMEYQQEKELNEKKLSFFTNMAHEVRTPLSLIINPVKQLLSTGENGFNNFELSVVYNNALRLLKITDQLLLFRSAESDTGIIKWEQVDFLNLCREVFISFANEAKSKEIRYELICDLNEVTLKGDADKLEIVLYNLISNAIKFTPEKGEVTVSLQKADDKIILTVKDTGLGIHESVGNRIFERYYQITERQEHLKPGFGIGLYLVKQIITLHEGHVSYANRKDAGVAFCVKIPLRLKEANGQSTPDNTKRNEVAVQAQEPAVFPVQNLANDSLSKLVHHEKAILIIDDDRHLVAYMKHVFKDFFILEATSGEEGWKIIQERQPALVLCDVKLPDVDGIELCKRIKSGSNGHIPVILLTASTKTDLKLQGVKSGADDYILKPFENEMLLARIKALLQNRASLKRYFLDEITLKHHEYKVSDEHKEFLEKCIAIIEANLDNDDFDSSMLASKMAMSRSSLYRKVNVISDLSVNEFVRLVRLRKAASMMIDTDLQIKEIAFHVGFSDIKYFRTQFFKLFDLKPSEYIKKYRHNFQDGAFLHGQFTKIKK